MYAQLNGNGFYRLQNTSTGRNVTIINDRIHLDNKEQVIDALKSTTSVDVYALETKKETVSDPASIIYLENVTGKQYNIKGQGMYTKALTAGRTMKVYQTGSNYELYASEEGFTVYLKDNDFASSKSTGYCTVATQEKGNCVWAIKPINSSNYLGIEPTITVGNKYYTTFYAGFAIQLSSGMKAYYVKEVSDKAAELVEISGDIVPEETPVILECSSKNTADNKVTPLVTGGTKPTTNQLKGVYFSYVSLNGRRTAEDPTNKYYTKLKNVVENKSTMRILGVVDGKLALVKATEADLYMKKYLPANKAYIQVKSTAASNIPLLDSKAYNESEKTINVGDASFLKEEDDNSVSFVGDKQASGDYEIPESVTEKNKTYTVHAIAAYAFMNNIALTGISIPATVTAIGEGAFSGCFNLMKIIVHNLNPAELALGVRTRGDASSVFAGVDYETCILYVPQASIQKYKEAPVWGDFKNIVSIETGISDIRTDEESQDVYNLKGQKVREQVRSIDDLPKGIYIINGKKVIRN